MLEAKKTLFFTFHHPQKNVSLCCKLLFIILLNSKRFEIHKTSVRKMVHNFNFFQRFGGSVLSGSWDPEQFSGSFTKYPRCPEIFKQHSVPLLCPVWSWNFEQGHGLHFYGYANQRTPRACNGMLFCNFETLRSPVAMDNSG